MESNDRLPQISSIDRLFLDVKAYRKSEKFKQMLDFYSNFPYLGVYNAALVEQQRPGARFVQTAGQWQKMFNRRIKEEARPVVILMPFYPVEFLFDISDTEKDPFEFGELSDEDIIESVIRQFHATTPYDISKSLETIKNNLSANGIKFIYYNTGSEEQAKIKYLNPDDRSVLSIYYKGSSIRYRNYYTISVQAHSDGATELASIFHELGHLFCHHLPSPGNWWDKRISAHDTKEFEAETVSYLLCTRLGIDSPSVEYLAGYIRKNEQIPPIRIDDIIRSVDEIEKLFKTKRNIKDCLLYKNDKEFKNLIDNIDANEKKEKAKAEKNSQKKPEYVEASFL